MDKLTEATEALIAYKLSRLSEEEKIDLSQKFSDFTNATIKDQKELDPDEAMAIYSATLEKWPTWERVLYFLSIMEIHKDVKEAKNGRKKEGL